MYVLSSGCEIPHFFPEMGSNLKHMEMMHSLCQQEVELLQQNLSLFMMESVNMQQLLNDFNGSKTNPANGLNGSNLFAALAFDRYMSQLSAITNMARKFNINLQLNRLGKMLTVDNVPRGDMGKAHLFQEFLQWNSILKEQGVLDIDCYTTSKGEEDGDFLKQNNAIEKAEPIIKSEPLIKSEDPASPRKTTALDLRVCSNPSVRHVRFLTESIPEQEDEDIDKPTGVVFRDLACFKNGYEFSAFITFVEDYDRLVFYINEMESSELFELSKMFHLQRYNSIKEIRQRDEVFGVSTNNESIMRAVLLPCSDPKAEQNLFLIDSGMEVSLSNHNQLFCLPLKYQLFPAQALKCVLLCINNDVDVDPKHLAEALRRNKLKEVDFRVEQTLGRTLHLRLLENVTSEKWGPPLMNAEEEGSANKNPFIDSSIDSKWIDHDNKAIESPTLTAAQDIASMDFVTADGSYENSKEGEMPWDKPNPPCSAGDLVTLTVTHVENVVSFYAQIETKENQQRVPLFWKDDSIRPDQKLLHPPKLQDLVLAQYHLDEFWYRARVMSFDKNTEEYTVFFVDYGNKEKVSLNRLFNYPATQNAVDGPFRAVRCRLAGICDITEEDERRQKLAMQLLLVNILNQKFDVEIKNVSEDNELLVHIVDQEFCDVPDVLEKLGYIRKI